MADAIPFPPPREGGPYLTADQIAAMLGRSAAWVRRVVPGKIALGHRTVRWRRDAFDRWVRSREDAG